MDSSTKRKVGALALIVAGIGAFLVPFLLHGPALQASNNGGGNTNGNNNNGGTGTTPTSPSCTSNCAPPSACTTNCNPAPTCASNCSIDTTPSTCASDPTSTDSSSQNNGDEHLAKGHDKQDKLDTSILSKAQGFMVALSRHNPQHDVTHSTKTDNDTSDTQGNHSNAQSHQDIDGCSDDQGDKQQGQTGQDSDNQSDNNQQAGTEQSNNDQNNVDN